MGDVHLFNKLGDGATVDLTGAQFGKLPWPSRAQPLAPHPFRREEALAIKGAAKLYETLRDRVDAALAASAEYDGIISMLRK